MNDFYLQAKFTSSKGLFSGSTAFFSLLKMATSCNGVREMRTKYFLHVHRLQALNHFLEGNNRNTQATNKIC